MKILMKILLREKILRMKMFLPISLPTVIDSEPFRASFAPQIWSNNSDIINMTSGHQVIFIPVNQPRTTSPKLRIEESGEVGIGREENGTKCNPMQGRLWYWEMGAPLCSTSSLFLFSHTSSDSLSLFIWFSLTLRKSCPHNEKLWLSDKQWMNESL